MPSYTFSDGKTEVTVFCKIYELEEVNERLKKEGFNRVISAPAIVSQAGSTLSKTDNGWKDVLKTIKKNSGKRSNINV